MSYTFTPSETFALSTHTVTFTSTSIKVKVTSSGQEVYNKDYTTGIAFRCDANNFEVGTLVATNVFTNQVNMSLRDAKLWLDEKNNANKFIGANDQDDNSIYNIYNLNQCPVRLSKSGNNAVMECPCTGTPCTNACYQYGI